jgi:MFS family permease
MIGGSKTLFFMYASTVLWTLGEIVNATNEGAYVANHTPISHRGRFNAILPFIGGLGWMISPPVTGKLIDMTSLGAVWPMIGAIAGISAMLIWVLGKLEDRSLVKKENSIIL